MPTFNDVLPPMKGHWKLDVYDGDPVRESLSDTERYENYIWKQLSPGSPPLHVGKILSTPIETLEGENLVTTVGKGLLLDRLFALGAPPGALTASGVGNSAQAAATGDVQLLGSAPVPFLKVFDALPTRAGLVVSSITTYLTTDAGATQNWQELAQFNGIVNNTSLMFNRIAPIGPFNKTAAVAIVVTVTITQG